MVLDRTGKAYSNTTLSTNHLEQYEFTSAYRNSGKRNGG